MGEHKTGYFGRIVAAILGRGTVRELSTETVEPAVEVWEPAVDVSEPAAGEVELRSRVATLEMDLAERDQRIAKMKLEYKQLLVAKDRVSEDAGEEKLERFLKKAVTPLSNLAALTDAAKHGHQVEIGDLLQLVGSLAKVFARAGLEQIGQAGEETAFDTSLHQRMSGGSVSAGKEVRVCVPGYRMGSRILLKAMVTSQGDD
jgi:molecular chaperone GrpE (heat shock protein)